MLSHLSFGVSDLARAKAFYERVLAPLGYVCVFGNAHAAASRSTRAGVPIITLRS